MPDWSMKGWQTGKPVTFLEALGVGKSKYAFTFPKLNPELPNAVAGAKPSKGNGGSGTPPPAKQTGAVKQYARKELAKYNWPGQFNAFNDIVMAESGWNPRIKNQDSGALGIAQALGHGNGSATQGTLGNEYGGYGLSDKEAKAANSGDAYWQIVWMMNYIKSRYGSPDAAWAYHKEHNSY